MTDIGEGMTPSPEEMVTRTCGWKHFETDSGE
jgi:hypothetical protein